jgi:hypothetical protein
MVTVSLSPVRVWSVVPLKRRVLEEVKALARKVMGLPLGRKGRVPDHLLFALVRSKFS